MSGKGTRIAFFFAVSAGLVALFLAVQRRRPLPLPPFLTILLENPITNAVVGPEALIERLELESGMRVLDAGCGPGRLTIPLARRVGPMGKVVALDGQEAMLVKLRVRLEREGVTNVRPRLGLLGAGDIEEREVYERVILAMVLGEVRDRGRALHEIYEVLKPGGLLSVTEAIGDPDYRGKRTVRQEAEVAGFELVRVFGGPVSFTMNFAKPRRRGAQDAAQG